MLSTAEDLYCLKISIQVYFKANKITVTTEKNVDWTVDGEFAGNTNIANIENCHKAIELAICEKGNE